MTEQLSDYEQQILQAFRALRRADRVAILRLIRNTLLSYRLTNWEEVTADDPRRPL